MGSTLRIKFAACLVFLMLSGCSFFDNSVQTCGEPQEYQDSVSIPPLIVPGYLRDIQNKSVFNIPNAQGSNILAPESFVMPMTSNKSLSLNNQSNQMINIKGDELSELLSLIDQTISNRQLEERYKPIYQTNTVDYEVDPSGKPCLDGPPKYFTESVSPRSMPTQTYTQSSEDSETEEGEKSRRQKRKEKRQQKTDKQEQEGTEEGVSSKDSEETEEDKSATIFKVLTESAIGAFTGGSATSTTLAAGSSIMPPKPVKPGDSETTDSTTKIELEVDFALAQRIRNLAISNPALSDEERVSIQNMTDKQILEIASETMKESQNKDSSDGSTSDAKKIDKKVSTTEEDDWFTQVKDQWAEGKAQREARREARQQRRTGEEIPKEEESNSSNLNKNQEKVNNETRVEVNTKEAVFSEIEDQDSAENEISDEEIIEEKEASIEEDDWFTQVKDQWAEGKAQREARREARQQRRTERQTQDD